MVTTSLNEFNSTKPLHFKFSKSKSKKKNLSDTTLVDSQEQNHRRNSETHDWQNIFNPQNLVQMFGQKKVEVIIGKISVYEIQWPEKQQKVEVTISQYSDWLNQTKSSDYGNLTKYPKKQYWAYLSYQRVFQLFGGNEMFMRCKPWINIFKSLDEQCKGEQSDLNLWWGSSGSYTPCHFDSNGFNIVFQVYGSKLWVLFPPSEYPKMYPTRIPYEETSVFSEINILQPDYAKHSKFDGLPSYSVTLNPGDVLFIPKHWWHYVESVSDSLSINSWFKMECDIFDRMKEIITAIHMNVYMNGIQIRDETVMSLIKMSEMNRSELVFDYFSTFMPHKIDLVRNPESLAKLKIEHHFLCSCKTETQKHAHLNTPFYNIKHNLYTLDLELNPGTNYKIKKLKKFTVKADSKNEIKIKRKRSRFSFSNNIKPLSNFLKSICDYANLDLIIYNHLNNA